jgi:hypothetical protein
MIAVKNKFTVYLEAFSNLENNRYTQIYVILLVNFVTYLIICQLLNF